MFVLDDLRDSAAGFKPTVFEVTLWVSPMLVSFLIIIWCKKAYYISRKIMVGHLISIKIIPRVDYEDKGAVIIMFFHFSFPDIKIFY